MPVVVVSSACTDGTFSCAGPFPEHRQIWGTRGDGFIETDLCEGAKMCVDAVLGLGMQYP